MKRFAFILLILLILSSCSGTIDRTQNKKDKRNHKTFSEYSINVNSTKMLQEAAFQDYLKSLSLHKKVCQLFIVNLVGDSAYLPVDGDEYIPGGYLFFGYNLKNRPEQVMNFTDSIREYARSRNTLQPFLAIDQEGGFVNRLRVLNGPLPSAERVSDRLSVEQAYKLYSLQALQMKALGFDMNLAPVVEICSESNKDFLNERSFGDVEKVIKYSVAAINAYENNGVSAVAKHFPGNTNTDPHTGLPEIKLSLNKLEESLEPFKWISDMKLSGVLMSHARTVAVDSKTPACLSHEWVTDRLINGYGFEGIVFSDDIFMGALNSNGFPPEKACISAINAGISCIMISEKRIKEPCRILISEAEKNPEFLEKINSAVEKVLRYKLSCGLVGFEKTGDSYKLVHKNPYENLVDRNMQFEKARLDNINLYIENF